MRTRDPKKYLAEINVIPYVDIMLVLLLIFMVTAPFLIQGIKIDLPQVDSAPIEDFENNSLTISIDSKGNYFLELDTFKNISMDLMKLESELIKIIPKNKKFTVNDLISKCIKSNKKIVVVPIFAAQWTDIGEWSQFEKKYININKN